MGADNSRVRFNPQVDYASVEFKQGAVLLDAEINELMAIVDRRLRALTSDTLGRATVSSTTPDAFKIGTTAKRSLQIGKGRLYVDGLLAENHGAESADPDKRVFDTLLAETGFVDAIGYEHQRYLPDPPALPTAGRHLVYLDAWMRDVTHLEQPDLVESAVAVETSSRVQTVWQVRVLADDAGASTDCATADVSMPGWEALIAPSTGVLTTGTVEIAPVDDPCDLPPSGGYRGPENQLYRVEIHDAGQPGGTATFKWSRDNASVGSRVKRVVSATALELDSLGRDDVLRFNRDDWVEIIDDTREFSQRCGEIRKIDIDEARHLVFTPALPAAMLAGANLRVRRWDQKHQVLKIGAAGTTSVFQDLDVGSSGVINVPDAGTTLMLENGVTVRFDSTGAKGFKCGDHWEFAARTSDASVEVLHRAPPRGIHHHYARLGLWDVGAGTVTDCRHAWPPATGDSDCGCTVCITPGGHLTLQSAFDKAPSGSTICLHAGHYPLREAMRIDGAKSLRIRGQGPATVIIAPGAAFDIQRSAGVTLEDLTIVSTGRTESAINVRTVFGLTLQRLIVAVFGDSDAQGAAIGLAGVVSAATIANNLLRAPDGVRAETTAEDAAGALVTAGLRIDDNVFLCRDAAVKLVGKVAHAYETRLSGNHVIGSHEVGLAVAGAALPGASVRIDANTLNVHGPGIRCAADGAWIEGNKIYATREENRVLMGSGIELAAALDVIGSDRAQVLANQISGFPGAGISINAPVQNLIVGLNIIDHCGNGIAMTDAASAAALRIENNQLRDIGVRTPDSADRAATSTVGIGITRCEAATVAGNSLRRIGMEIGDMSLVAGIAAFSVRHPRIIGNEVSELGPADDIGGLVAGIIVRAPYRQAEVVENHVERDRQANETASGTPWLALQIDTPTSNGDALTRLGGHTALQVDANRTLSLFGRRAHVDSVIGMAGLDPAAGAAAATRAQGPSASILGNVLNARGRAPAVLVTAGGDVLFNGNRCELPPGSGGDVVRLNTPVAVVNANLVRGAEFSIRVLPTTAQVAAIGNITTTQIQPLRPEMVPLNVVIA